MQKSLIRGLLFVYLPAIIFFKIDQWSKAYIADNFLLYESRPTFKLWNNLQIFFTYVHNDGAAFSTFRGQMTWLSLVAMIVVVGIVIYERRLPTNRSPLLSLSLGCILGGALGNLVDRVALRYVIDFMDLRYFSNNAWDNIWPIWNVADMCINLGVGLLILYFLITPEEAVDEKIEIEAHE